MNVWALNVKALKFICSVKEHIDTEIYGRFFNRPELFNVKEISIAFEDSLNIPRLTVDEYNDYKLKSSIYNAFDKNHIIEENDS